MAFHTTNYTTSTIHRLEHCCRKVSSWGQGLNTNLLMIDYSCCQNLPVDFGDYAIDLTECSTLRLKNFFLLSYLNLIIVSISVARTEKCVHATWICPLATKLLGTGVQILKLYNLSYNTASYQQTCHNMAANSDTFDASLLFCKVLLIGDCRSI